MGCRKFVPSSPLFSLKHASPACVCVWLSPTLLQIRGPITLVSRSRTSAWTKEVYLCCWLDDFDQQSLLYRMYSSEIDIWSIGCVFGELLLRRPLFEALQDTQFRKPTGSKSSHAQPLCRHRYLTYSVQLLEAASVPLDLTRTAPPTGGECSCNLLRWCRGRQSCISLV